MNGWIYSILSYPIRTLTESATTSQQLEKSESASEQTRASNQESATKGTESETIQVSNQERPSEQLNQSESEITPSPSQQHSATTKVGFQQALLPYISRLFHQTENSRQLISMTDEIHHTLKTIYWLAIVP